MIKAIFLDFEGVITKDGQSMHKGLFPLLKNYYPFEEFDRRYNLAKVGKISFEKFMEGIPKNERFLHFDKVNYQDGAKDALEKLYKKYPLYIASNHTPKYFEKSIKLLKAKKYFKKLFPSFTLKCAKPHKEYFKKILKLSRKSAAQSIFVDDAKRNLIPAKEIGFTTVWVNNHVDDSRNNHDYKPDYEITDLRELVKIVEKLNQKK